MKRLDDDDADDETDDEDDEMTSTFFRVVKTASKFTQTDEVSSICVSFDAVFTDHKKERGPGTDMKELCSRSYMNEFPVDDDGDDVDDGGDGYEIRRRR